MRQQKIIILYKYVKPCTKLSESIRNFGETSILDYHAFRPKERYRTV